MLGLEMLLQLLKYFSFATDYTKRLEIPSPDNDT